MRFLELQPQALRIAGNSYLHVDTLAEAQGVMYLCPRCFVTNGGGRGTHRVLTWFSNRAVPDDLDPKPGRWTPIGTSFDDLTLEGNVPGSARSVALGGPCAAHFLVTDGEVTFC